MQCLRQKWAARDLQFKHDALACACLTSGSEDPAWITHSRELHLSEKGSLKLSRSTGDLPGELGDAVPATHSCRAAFWLPGGEQPPTAFLSHAQWFYPRIWSSGELGGKEKETVWQSESRNVGKGAFISVLLWAFRWWCSMQD